jgi:hypothetical protein
MYNQENIEKAFGLLTKEKPNCKEELNFEGDIFLVYEGFNGSGSIIPFFEETIKDFLSELKKQKSKNEISYAYLRFLKEELTNILESYSFTTMHGEEFYYQKNTSIFSITPETAAYSLKEAREHIFNDIVKISQKKYEITKNLLTEINEYLLNEPVTTTESSYKMDTNLSVPDLALLFRLLDESSIINTKHKTEIYRFINKNFKTKNQDNISESSVKNKFLSPDNKSLRNLDILLTNLKQQLKKIQ